MSLNQIKKPSSRLGAHGSERLRSADQPDEKLISSDDVAETVGLAEEIEALGIVSETIREDSSKKGDGKKGSGKPIIPQAQVGSVRLSLLEKAPSRDLMLRQIRAQINNEISQLHKTAMKIVGSHGSAPNYSQLNSIVAQIRRLRGILNTLIKSSMKRVRALWLRYVHGIM